MAISKSTKMIILLCIDVAFFFLELIIGELHGFLRFKLYTDLFAGYAVHSLALVADSFHMVRDKHAIRPILP